MGTLYIFRGLPGSGKSTRAAKLAAELKCEHFEADQFFMVDGEYRFNPKMLHAAHGVCYTNTLNELYAGNNVIVSNTFTTLKEMENYIESAVAFGANVYIIECDGDYGSIHNVPQEAIERMKRRWLDSRDLRAMMTSKYGHKVIVQ